jgi:hypothetical protein
LNLGSAQNPTSVLNFKIVYRFQYWTKISETGAKTSGISLANHINNNHLIRSYREKVLTILVESCPKTRKQFFQQKFTTSNSLSEFVPNPNHIKFIFKLKEIKRRIQKSNSYSIIGYTTVYIQANEDHTNVVSKS